MAKFAMTAGMITASSKQIWIFELGRINYITTFWRTRSKLQKHGPNSYKKSSTLPPILLPSGWSTGLRQAKNKPMSCNLALKTVNEFYFIYINPRIITRLYRPGSSHQSYNLRSVSICEQGTSHTSFASQHLWARDVTNFFRFPTPEINCAEQDHPGGGLMKNCHVCLHSRHRLSDAFQLFANGFQ